MYQTFTLYLGRWSSIAMVERYTRSVKFEDSLKLYATIVALYALTKQRGSLVVLISELSFYL
jgi:hypothetical protein